MYDQNQQDQTPFDYTHMYSESPSALGPNEGGLPLSTRSRSQYPPPSTSSFSTLATIGPSISRRTRYQMNQHQTAEDVAESIEIEQPVKHGARPSQNRAPFGKWRSKGIPGFPAVDTPLPAGLSAQDICERYPNHVDDHVILELMRRGKGAKAIDALIPPPPGKTKAGQSHSKIQLRISTIREAFPDEVFPITSTKRNRERSHALRDEEMTPEVDPVESLPVNAFSARSPKQRPGGLLSGIDSNNPFSARDPAMGSVPGIAGTRWSPQADRSSIFTKEPRSHQAAFVNLSSFEEKTAGNDSVFLPPHPIYNEIRDEHQMHAQLVFEIFFSNTALAPQERASSVQSFCDMHYDEQSQKLQQKAGSKLNKTISPRGARENSIVYMRRSIAQCFERLPEFQALIDYDCPPNQITQQVQLAICRYLLGRLRQWTVVLQEQREVLRQIRQHEELHAQEGGRSDLARNEAPCGMKPSRPLPGALQQGHGLPEMGRRQGSTEEMPWSPSAHHQGVTIEDILQADLDAAPTPYSLRPANHPLEQSFLAFPEGSPSHLAGVSGTGPSGPREPEEVAMVDAPDPGTRTHALGNDFDGYAEEAGDLFDPQVRQTHLCSAAVDPPIALAGDSRLLPEHDHLFVLRTWQSVTRAKFGNQAEAKLAEQRNPFSDKLEDEMNQALWRGMQGSELS